MFLHKVRRAWILAIALTTSTASLAEPLAGLQKAGQAKLSVYFWDVYHASLFTNDGKYQQDNYPIALKLDYLRDIDSEDLLENTADEWKKLGVKQSTFSPWMPLLKDIFPDIKKGDNIILLVDKSQHSQFYYNGKPKGSISDQDFGQQFLRIWLDKNASYPKVRNQLIGLNK